MKKRSASALRFFRLLFFLPMVLLFLAGCGRKGPPVAPGPPAMPQPIELKGALQGDTAELNWRRPANTPRLQAFAVLRARTGKENPPCPGCPLEFEEIGSVTVHRGMENFQFSEPTAAGFSYTYKVQAVGPGGGRGQESNRVTIDRTGP